MFSLDMSNEMLDTVDCLQCHESILKMQLRQHVGIHIFQAKNDIFEDVFTLVCNVSVSLYY
jgi:hypothetical protein